MNMITRNQRNQFVTLSFVCLVFCLISYPAGTYGQTSEEEKVFVIHAPIRDLDEYRILAEQAARLKPFGRVEVNVSSLAEKGFHDVPEGRNFWYEYTSYNPTPYKFFPDP